MLSLPLLGLLSGIIALVATKRYGHKGISGMAATGTVFCSICILIMIVVVMAARVYALDHAAKMREQKTQQSH